MHTWDQEYAICACLISLRSYGLYPAFDSEIHKGRNVAPFVTTVFPEQALDLAPNTHSINFRGGRGSYADEQQWAPSSAKPTTHGRSPYPLRKVSFPPEHGPGMSESPSRPVFWEAATGACPAMMPEASEKQMTAWVKLVSLFPASRQAEQMLGSHHCQAGPARTGGRRQARECVRRF